VDMTRGTSATVVLEQIPSVLAAVTSSVQWRLERHEDAGDTRLVERYLWLQRRLAQLS